MSNRKVEMFSSMLILIASASIVTSIRGCLAWQNQDQNYRRYQSPIRSRNGHVGKELFLTTNHMTIDRASVQLKLSASLDQTVPTKEASSSILDHDTLGGVKEFESWFSNVPGSRCDPYIVHTNFGSLRGLGTQDRSITSNNKSWMTIPRSIVIQSDFREKDWDAELAQSLWKEILKGSSTNSSIAGYVSLLTKGSSWTPDQLPDIPPFTAPDALRHWTAKEMAKLKTHKEGQQLLRLQLDQEKLWKEKFKKIKTPGMTWEQFEWAMEAVHSRAFCGDFGTSGGLPTSVTIGSPIVAAVAGYVYFVQLHGLNDAILYGLAALAAIPSVINMFKGSPPVAVLLPLIDSANHDEGADSLIEYSHLTDSFDLSGGSKCLQTEENGKQQLYISYGKKSPTELLLNYGFLKDVSNGSEGDASERRMKLALHYVTSE
mmetsp:Transcript_53119/g.60188  ORF Transcript_53119/g.60188 Transcript_53119/m.60188 type:complete len:431 (-) Transcript_53119:33-1325(-)